MSPRHVLRQLRAAGAAVDLAGSGVLLVAPGDLPRQLVSEFATHRTAIGELLLAELHAERDAYLAKIPAGECRELARFALASEFDLHAEWHRALVEAGIEAERIPTRRMFPETLLVADAAAAARFLVTSVEVHQAAVALDRPRLDGAIDAWVAAANDGRKLIGERLGAAVQTSAKRESAA